MLLFSFVLNVCIGAVCEYIILKVKHSTFSDYIVDISVISLFGPSFHGRNRFIFDISENVRSLFKEKNEDQKFFAIFYFDVSKVDVFIINKYLSKGIKFFKVIKGMPNPRKRNVRNISYFIFLVNQLLQANSWK